MHIGFLTPEYPHPRANGAAGIGTSIKNLAEGLVEKGTTVTIFIYGQKENAIFVDNKIRFHLIKQKKYLLIGWFLYRKFLQNYINKISRKEFIDVIEAPDWTGITAFINLDVPIVIRMNGTDAYFCKLENRHQKFKNFLFEKKALLNANYLLSVSEFTAGETAEIFHLKDNIEIIPNSVNVSLFTPQEREVLPNSIFYFGSLIRKKGVLELMKIFNCISAIKPETLFVIAGKDVKDKISGRPTKDLMSEILTPAAAKQVKWLGELAYDKIKKEIASAQVVVLPSFAEALPMTWIESMALEKPLVTSNIGWAKEVMVDGITGFTVNPENHEEYAERILWLLNHPEEAKQMGSAARVRVQEKFSTDVVVEKNLKFYKRILSKS